MELVTDWMRYGKQIALAGKNGGDLPSTGELKIQYEQWRTLRAERNVLAVGLPWITFSAIDYLLKYLKSDMKVFEFGGGGSTAFFASRVAEVVTVEHDGEWFKALKEKFTENTPGWRGVHVGADPEEQRETPAHYISRDETFLGRSFRNYASVIDSYPDEYFDVVLVDGRGRTGCLMHSLRKVKKNGLLILDNADRKYYLEEMTSGMDDYELVLGTFGPTPYHSEFSQTNIWRRK